MRFALLLSLVVIGGCSTKRATLNYWNELQTERWVAPALAGETKMTYFDPIGNKRIVIREDGRMVIEVLYLRSGEIFVRLPERDPVQVDPQLLILLESNLQSLK